MFQLDDMEYAAVVHSTNISNPENSTRLVIFRKLENKDFLRIYNASIPYIVSLDCLSYGSFSFVSTAVDMRPEHENTHLYSPIFRVQKGDKVDVVEKNTWWRIRTAKMWKYGNDVFLTYTFENDLNYDSIAGAFICPIFKFTAGFIFEIWKEVPCSNAIRIEAFSIISDMYVAVANSRDASNNTETYTVIYKFDLNLDKFVSFQSILVNKIVDLRHFTSKVTDEVANFLAITSASLIDRNEVAEIEREGYSAVIIYKWVEEIFLPMQNIIIEKPTHVLPHIWNNKEMVLLIVSEIAPVQFYHYIGWKFEDTELKEEPPAFESGVSSLRNYVNKRGDSIVLLANSKLFGSSPNLFKMHFRVDEDPDLYQGILDWCEQSIRDLQGFDYEKLLKELEAIKKEQEGIINDLVISGSVMFDGENITLNKVITDHVQGEDFKAAEEEQIKMTQIKELVKNMEKKLAIIGEQIGRSMTKADQEAIVKSSQSREIVVDELEVKDIETQFVNGKPIDLWAHADQELFVGTLRADQLIVHERILLAKYNNLLESALKIEGDQVLNFSIECDEASVDRLVVGESINDNDIHAITAALREMSMEKEEITIDHVHVKNLHGLVNGQDFEKLDRLILKNNGDQTLEGWTELDNLVVGNSAEIVGPINGFNFSQMRVLNNDLAFEKEVHFEQTPHFADLHVKDHLGSLKIRRNGDFGILLKRAPHIQIIKGETVFDEVKLMEPITLHVSK